MCDTHSSDQSPSTTENNSQVQDNKPESISPSINQLEKNPVVQPTVEPQQSETVNADNDNKTAPTQTESQEKSDDNSKFTENQKTQNPVEEKKIEEPTPSKELEENLDNDKAEERTSSQEKVYKEDKKEGPNVLFYRNKRKSEPSGVYLDEMHQWWGDYEELEINHSYIQWLFPNFFRSFFNSCSYPLTEEEAEIFRTDPEIAEKLVKSYKMILDFYGCTLDEETGKLTRTKDYKERYINGLIKYTHNHLRMRRILMHLNNVGFRRYAIELVNHWEKEIYGEAGGYEMYLKNKKSKNFEQAPLKKLARWEDVFKVWSYYGDHKGDPERIKLLEANCFMKFDNYKESVFFERFKLKHPSDNKQGV